MTSSGKEFDPTLDSRDSLLSGAVAINLTLIGTLLTALVVAREWERGTMEALLATPARRWEMLVGKIVPYFALGINAMAISVGVAVVGYGVPFRGSVGLLDLSMVVYLSALIGVGLFASSLARIQHHTIIYSSMFVVPTMLLSGFATPVENMPDWLQVLTEANPIRHFMVILKGVFLRQLPAAEVARHLAPLVVIASVTLSAASWLFRWRLE